MSHKLLEDYRNQMLGKIALEVTMELNNQNSFGIGEGELIEIIYELPLPMRLDRWLVKSRTK